MLHGFFWLREALGQKKAVCRDAQRGVVMESTPTAPFEMIQAELLLEFLIVAFDAPTQFGHPHQLLDRGRGRERRQEVLDRLGVVLGPFDEQPLFGAQPTAPVVTMRAAARAPRQSESATPDLYRLAK